MVTNCNPLRSISEIFDHVHEARIFIKWDLSGANILIRIKEAIAYITAIWTSYTQFKYRTMPFSQSNAPAMFQSDMDDCLRPCIDNFVVCYLDDILIHLTNKKEHVEHVREVLQQLKEFGADCKAENGQFGVSEIGSWGSISLPMESA